MKPILATIIAAGSAFSALAQGTVLFDNNTSGIGEYQITGHPAFPLRAIGESQQNPDRAIWHVSLLFNATPGGGIAQSSLIDLVDYTPNVANNVNDGDGSFEYTSGGKEVIITTPSGSGSATFEVVSWLGTATSWAGALSGGATFATQGVDLVEFTAAIANPGTTPPGVPRSVNGPGQWDGNLYMSIPEPSTFALGGLGAAMLYLFRRASKRGESRRPVF